jgi:imidazole glycerol-phosphate synthase subunit HisH
MKTVAIIDYGMGNVDSVARGVEECGADPIVTDDAAEIRRASNIILPGVGAFGDGMRELQARSLDRVLREEAVEGGIPLLGICLGMQLLATTGHEGGELPGLGFVPGEVVRFKADTPDTRIPHVGWNEVEHDGGNPLFDGIPSGKDFYFVHSFHFQCANPVDVVARTPYCGGFVSCVQRDAVIGVQFHPEKSQRVGLALLRNFLSL